MVTEESKKEQQSTYNRFKGVLSSDKIEEINTKLDSGKSQKDIANEYGLNYNTFRKYSAYYNREVSKPAEITEEKEEIKEEPIEEPEREPEREPEYEEPEREPEREPEEPEEEFEEPEEPEEEFEEPEEPEEEFEEPEEPEDVDYHSDVHSRKVRFSDNTTAIVHDDDIKFAGAGADSVDNRTQLENIIRKDFRPFKIDTSKSLKFYYRITDMGGQSHSNGIKLTKFRSKKDLIDLIITEINFTLDKYPMSIYEVEIEVTEI